MICASACGSARAGKVSGNGLGSFGTVAARRRSDAVARTGGAVPPGGGWHGSGPAGGGPAAEGAAGLRSDVCEHHERIEADGRERVLWGPEAGSDPALAGAAAT